MTIIAEFQIDVPSFQKSNILEWIERFRHAKYRNHPRLHRSFGEVITSEKGVLYNWIDTIPSDGHIEFSILYPFKDKKGFLRVRGVQRPTYQRVENTSTISEYMTALQENTMSLTEFLGLIAKAQVEKRRSA